MLGVHFFCSCAVSFFRLRRFLAGALQFSGLCDIFHGWHCFLSVFFSGVGGERATSLSAVSGLVFSRPVVFVVFVVF